MILRNDHIFLTCAPDMREIAKPLLALGITYFSYSRSTNDGGRLWLCTSSENVKSYYADGRYRIGNTECHPNSHHAQVVLWATLPNQRVYETTKQLGIDHGIFIIKPQQDCCEFLAFATTPNNYQIINTYLTNMDFLNKFGDYFKEKARSLIKKGEKNKLYLPYHNKVISCVDNANLNSLFDSNYPTKLSPRQYSCAQLLLQGNNIKEIAKQLSLSPRTIETYIDNLKTKLRCQNKTELILKLSGQIERYRNDS